MKKKILPTLKLHRKRQRKIARRKHREVRLELHSKIRHEAHMLRMGGGIRPAVELQAPQIFCLQPGYHERLVPFLRELVRRTLIDGETVCIDFRRTERFVADGALLFQAELERILGRKPKAVRCFPPRDSVCQQVMSHLGLLRSMGCMKVIPSDRDDVLHWESTTGTRADATMGLGLAIANVPGLSPDQRSYLFRGVSEALTNVPQHAYHEPRRDGTGVTAEQRWWTYVRREPDSIIVVFCDLGVGVPYTVPRLAKHSSWLPDRLGSMLNAAGVRAHRDGEIIRATVEEKLSRYAKEHRGNGFANMVQAIESSGAGRMDIISNRGSYTFEKGPAGERVSAANFLHSIYGTVIAWKLVLPQSELAEAP